MTTERPAIMAMVSRAIDATATPIWQVGESVLVAALLNE